MKNIWCVIGANYGDEGKGNTVHSIAKTLDSNNTLVVRYNGGAQAGHGVTNDDGLYHTFRHFGSATLLEIPTYLSDEFILNPVLFRQEWEELESKGITPVVYASHNCRVTTPYDMLMNLLKEESRGESKHGTCGCGIFETINRYKNKPHSLPYSLYSVCGYDSLKSHVGNIHKYYLSYKDEITCENKELLELDVFERFYEDVEFMRSRIKLHDDIFDAFDNVIFESAQGLLLDEKYGIYPHLTPSSVGFEVPSKYIELYKAQHVDVDINRIEVLYISRVYATRHGNGPLIHECDKSSIGVNNPNEANVYNENQGNFRYAPLDVSELKNRILKDFLGACKNEIDIVSVVFTCLDQIEGNLFKMFDNKHYSFKDCVMLKDMFNSDDIGVYFCSSEKGFSYKKLVD